MKKSNILLLNGFLAILLLVTAIHFKLYSMYKKGDYTVHKRSDFIKTPPMQSFQQVKFVVVRNVPFANVSFAGAAQVEKNEGGYIQYIQTGDSLVITGLHPAEYANYQHPVTFNLPYNSTVSAVNSSLTFHANTEEVENSPVIHLQNSKAFFFGEGHRFKFGHVKIFASDSSSAEFHHKTDVDNLEVQLSNSTIQYSDGKLGQLSIITDSLSIMALPYKHLMNAKITINENR
jgi:hypothetical protein